MDALDNLSKASSLAAEASEELSNLVEKRSDELQALKDAIDAATSELAIVAEQLDTETTEFKAKKADYAVILVGINEKIDASNKVLAKATADVESAQRKHSQFVKYEIEHRRALETREKSIAEREDAVASVIGQMKRRKQIVDDIT